MRSLTETEIQRHVGEIDGQGFSIMEQAFDASQTRAILAELTRLEAVRPGGDIAPAPFTGFHTRRWFDLLNDADIWQQVAIHPGVLAVLPHVLRENFLLSTMGTAVIGPGEERQMIHTDDSVYMLPRPHPNLVCNTMWALNDFTEANGGTRLVPGSNQWPQDPDVPTALQGGYDTVPLEMPAGSIAFVVGSCYHGAGANSSDATRYGLTINYCNGRMRQQENLMLGIRPERMMTFPRPLQDILGFKICQGAGHIFASDPRAELERRYADVTAGSASQDPYMARRDSLQNQRLAKPTKG